MVTLAYVVVSILSLKNIGFSEKMLIFIRITHSENLPCTDVIN